MDDRDRVESRPPWVPWAFTSLALVLVAAGAYWFGQHHQVITGDDAPVHRMYWGYFPGFFFFWIFLWVILGGFRRMWWYGGYRPYYRPWRYSRYSHPYDDEREFEEWHRREHERMDSRTRGASSPGASGGSDRGPIT